MEQPQEGSLNIRRGLIASVHFALCGALACAIVAFATTIYRWIVYDTLAYSRWVDFRELPNEWVSPVIGIAAFSGAAGWATYAPAGTYRFPRSLAWIFAISMPMYIVLGLVACVMELTPPRYKAIEHPLFYARELILMVGPPIAAAAILTAMRRRKRPA